jgi:hypothetical protein
MRRVANLLLTCCVLIVSGCGIATQPLRRSDFIHDDRAVLGWLASQLNLAPNWDVVRSHVHCQTFALGKDRQEIEKDIAAIKYEPRRWDGKKVTYEPIWFSSDYLGLMVVEYEQAHTLSAKAITVSVQLRLGNTSDGYDALYDDVTLPVCR